MNTALSLPGQRDGGDRGSAVVEFLLVSVLLMFLTMAIMQVAVYLYIRNIAVTSATEGARYAANADVDPQAGGERAHELVARGVGSSTASRLNCVGAEENSDRGVVLSAVRCSGEVPPFFAPVKGLLPLDVSAHAVEEGS